MSKKANQKGTERNIVSVPLADIQPSAYNPRKNFDQDSLSELSESIRRQGVLQPIGLRPLAELGRYEIVFGERRYRASLMAGLTEIPATVMDISDAEAEEMAITENLQRKDVTPMEESDAYRRLMDTGRYDVQSLVVQFGKSENYIRTRLKFSALIPEIAGLLERDEITISAADEICRYGEDIQRDMYENHLKDVWFNNWRGLKASDLAASIEKKYTNDLSRYDFDKTACLSCSHNTRNMDLFCSDGCGSCVNRTCLQERYTSYLVEKALKLMDEHPDALLCRQEFSYNADVVKRLADMGHDVKCIKGYLTSFPKMPLAPIEENYESEEEYDEAYAEYEEKKCDYDDTCENIMERVRTGNAVLCIQVQYDDVILRHMPKPAATTNVGTQSPVEMLEIKDRRNKEIAHEKTVEDVKKSIVKADVSSPKFDADEEKMLYFFLLSSLNSRHFEKVGLGDKNSYHYLEDKEKMDIVSDLTPQKKAIIRRDFLIEHFRNAGVNSSASHMLLEFAKKHMPSELAEIRKVHEEVYEKRHQGIEKRKAALLSKKQKEDGQPEKGAVA